MRLTVIGTGYVGLVAGASFADFGNHVICVDIDPKRVASLRRAELPIYEPGLGDLVARNVERGRLEFTTNATAAVGTSEVVFIAVGTPSNEEGDLDPSQVLAACRSVAAGLRGPSIVAIKSTVPVGTADAIESLFAEQTPHPVAVVSNPEFLKEGDALNDFMKPSRVILGSNNDRAAKIVSSLYEPFTRTNNRIELMDRRSAELTKIAANAMLATRISFMNELSQLADALGADIENVRRGIGSDPRIGNKYLFPGIGFGGSCLPKDLRALVKTASDHDVALAVAKGAELANQRQKRLLRQLVELHFRTSLSGKRIALWGLSFKPSTDDVRESSAIEVARDLVAAGAQVCAYDPAGMDAARVELGDTISFADNMYEAAANAEGLVLATEWRCFRRPDFARLAAEMSGTALFDGRNIWNPREVRSHGLHYVGIGRACLNDS